MSFLLCLQHQSRFGRRLWGVHPVRADSRQNQPRLCHVRRDAPHTRRRTGGYVSGCWGLLFGCPSALRLTPTPRSAKEQSGCGGCWRNSSRGGSWCWWCVVRGGGGFCGWVPLLMVMRLLVRAIASGRASASLTQDCVTVVSTTLASAPAARSAPAPTPRFCIRACTCPCTIASTSTSTITSTSASTNTGNFKCQGCPPSPCSPYTDQPRPVNHDANGHRALGTKAAAAAAAFGSCNSWTAATIRPSSPTFRTSCPLRASIPFVKATIVLMLAQEGGPGRSSQWPQAPCLSVFVLYSSSHSVPAHTTPPSPSTVPRSPHSHCPSGNVMAPMIPRNSPVPIIKSQNFTTSSEDQSYAEIRVLQGERSIPPSRPPSLPPFLPVGHGLGTSNRCHHLSPAANTTRNTFQ